MTDHRVSNFMFKKSNHVVAPASKYPVKATSDTVSVNPFPLLQQYICVGYDSRELVDVLKYELCVYPTTLFEATGTMLQSGKPAWANPLNSMENRTDTCVIMWKLCEYVKKEWWKTIVFDCGPSIKDDFHLRWKESSECNRVLFTRHMACTPCKEDSLQQSEQTEVHLFVGWWNGDTY